MKILDRLEALSRIVLALVGLCVLAFGREWSFNGLEFGGMLVLFALAD